MSTPVIEVFRSSLTVRWNTVLFPFTPIDLVHLMPQLGYVQPENVQQWLTVRPTVDVEGGVIGRKGRIAVQINVERNYVGLYARDLEDALQEFGRLEEALQSDLDIDVQEKALFYEFTTNAVASTGHSPLEAFHSQLDGGHFLTRASEIVGTDLGTYGVRLTDQLADPNQVNWTDFKIEPAVHAAHRQYLINVVYRRNSREPVLKLVESFDEVISRLIEAIEGNL